ncbi:hypothetical protein RhiirC2_776573 [Rhizophagus irregularis]|uniref:Uncharacterized protein n=1 Tax=Rhizophagus irregularis TaxID=588596 RepID=A0A2N1NGL3_9GLOM|nr:hypothetical protein RhiirC2_776573 [Rhizophagus irregularis]
MDGSSNQNGSLFNNIASTDVLKKYFCELEEIPTKEFLDDGDIIKLVQDEICDEHDSEEEQIKMSFGDAFI